MAKKLCTTAIASSALVKFEPWCFSITVTHYSRTGTELSSRYKILFY
jgi:hypothetical protein